MCNASPTLSPAPQLMPHIGALSKRLSEDYCLVPTLGCGKFRLPRQWPWEPGFEGGVGGWHCLGTFTNVNEKENAGTIRKKRKVIHDLSTQFQHHLCYFLPARRVDGHDSLKGRSRYRLLEKFPKAR